MNHEPGTTDGRRLAVLSPHLDDAVLSLWHVLSGPGDVAVVNVFDAPPRGRDCAEGWWDALTRADDAVARARERRAEDRDALALAGRQPVGLGFVDSQYGLAPAAPASLACAIDAAAPAPAVLLAPAALSGHRDHRSVLGAALVLAERGRVVALYADVPHATRRGWPAWVTGAQPEPVPDPSTDWERELCSSGISLAALRPEVRRLDEVAHARKLAAVNAYRTQLPALEARFGLLSRPDVLRYELVWSLP
jgi:LmbE family N-acetylglucosaminyl deacetylase